MALRLFFCSLETGLASCLDKRVLQLVLCDTRHLFPSCPELLIFSISDPFISSRHLSMRMVMCSVLPGSILDVYWLPRLESAKTRLND